MRVSDLHEEDFHKEAGKAISDIGALFGKAHSALKGSYDKAKGELEGEGRRAAAQASADAKKAQQAAEKEKQEAQKKSADERAAKQKALGASVPQLVAKVVLDRTPDDPDIIEEFHTLDVEQFNSVYLAIDKAKERLSKFPRELRKVLKASDFLQDKSRSDNELNDMLGEQPEKGMEAAEDMLMKNLYDEQEVWAEVLNSDDGAGAAQNMLGLIKAISRDFAARNLAATGSGAKKNFPEGTGIVRIMSTQRQLISMRLGLLTGAVEQLANKPVTEAALKRVRRLLERLGSS